MHKIIAIAAIPVILFIHLFSCNIYCSEILQVPCRYGTLSDLTAIQSLPATDAEDKRTTPCKRPPPIFGR